MRGMVLAIGAIVMYVGIGVANGYWLGKRATERSYPETHMTLTQAMNTLDYCVDTAERYQAERDSVFARMDRSNALLRRRLDALNLMMTEVDDG